MRGSGFMLYPRFYVTCRCLPADCEIDLTGKKRLLQVVIFNGNIILKFVNCIKLLFKCK
jgi:hypothetical protein